MTTDLARVAHHVLSAHQAIAGFPKAVSDTESPYRYGRAAWPSMRLWVKLQIESWAQPSKDASELAGDLIDEAAQQIGRTLYPLESSLVSEAARDYLRGQYIDSELDAIDHKDIQERLHDPFFSLRRK